MFAIIRSVLEDTSVCPPHSAKVFEFLLKLFQTLVEVSVQVLFRLPSKPSNLFEGPGWCLG